MRQAGVAAGVGGVQGNLADIGQGDAGLGAETGERRRDDAFNTLLGGETIFPGADESVAGGAPGVQHIVGEGIAGDGFGNQLVRIIGIIGVVGIIGNVGGDDESGGAVAGGAFRFAAGRALAAVGDDDQNLAGAAGIDGVQGGFDGGGAGAEDAGEVGGENIGPQVEGGGDDGGVLLFGVGGRGGGKDDAVDGAAVAAGQGIGAGGDGHGDAVLVEVGDGAFLAGIPAGGVRPQPKAGNVGAVSGDAGHLLLPVVADLFSGC